MAVRVRENVMGVWMIELHVKLDVHQALVVSVLDLADG